MAGKLLEFRPEAIAEYELARDWYFNQSERVASKLWEEVTNAVNKIVAAPQRYPTHIRGTRRLLVQKFPFAVIYRESPVSILVVAVAHLSRRPAYSISRI